MRTKGDNPKQFEGPTKTQQHHKNSCDIHAILAQYRKKGYVDPRLIRSPQYGDFSSFGTFAENIQQVQEAEAMFNALPSKLRDRFKNDPVQLMDFCNDPNNREEAIQIGLIDGPEMEVVDVNKFGELSPQGTVVPPPLVVNGTTDTKSVQSQQKKD